MHYTNIAIYGYKNGELYEIFENGSACLVETDFKAKRPMIKVGRENWEQEGWCYATGEPLWQVYVWNGKEFVYNKKLSTTPEISEQEATVRFINTVKERMQEIDSWHNKAIELRKEGKYNEAESLFKKIITAEPTNPNAHFDLGNVYFFEKRYNDALDYYNKSIDLGLDSEYIATYYYMSSLCYIGLGNNKEAIAYLKKCLKANPNYENAKELLELVEEAHKNGEKLNIEEEPIKSKVKGIFA
jgi:tetratricopeptide (TPR) repeat protein